MGISVSQINNIQEPTPDKEPKQMAFRANSTNALERNPQADSFDKPKKHTGLWVTLGILGTAGLAIGFDYWKYKGKHCKEIWNKIKGFFDNKTKPTGSDTPNTSEGITQIKEFSLADFKKNGKFDKGKALLSDGSGYTGKITNPTKDGNLVLEYENGILQKSTKFKGEEIDWQKTYERRDNYLCVTLKNQYDPLPFIKRFNPETGIIGTSYGGNRGTHFVYDTKNKRILMNKKLDYIYDQEGKLQCLKRCSEKDVDTIFYPDGKTVRCKYSKGGYIFYDESGKELAVIAHDKNLQTIEYPTKNIGIEFYKAVEKDSIDKSNTITFRDNKTRNRSSRFWTTRSFEDSKLIEKSTTATFYRNKGNKIEFDYDRLKGLIKIEIGKNKATFNLAANKFESIEGSWTEEELRKLMSEYEAKAKEQIALARQAQRDYIKYEKEIFQHGCMI